jgi:hypothetical protein
VRQAVTESLDNACSSNDIVIVWGCLDRAVCEIVICGTYKVRKDTRQLDFSWCRLQLGNFVNGLDVPKAVGYNLFCKRPDNFVHLWSWNVDVDANECSG